MSITGTSCHRGTASILGTLVFVGIIFTSFIPMMLLMNQADMLYDMRKHELGILDQERIDEEISFYAYPDSDDKIVLSIKNKGKTLIKIVNVWINDVEYPQNVNINAMETINLDPLVVTLQDLTSYTVKVITENGNVFSSEAGTLYYSSSADGWYTPSLGICVHIENLQGKYQIIIKINLGDAPLDEHSYTSGGMEHEDIEEMFWVDTPGIYYLTIKKWDGGDWVLDVIPRYDDEPIDVLWPATRPITDVYVSGIFS